MRATIHALTMAFILFVALLAQAIPKASPTAEPRPIRVVKMKFRADYCYWDNGTYSIWEANTSELPDTWLSREIVCTAENNYNGETVYTGGIAWVSNPLLADFYVEGDVLIKVWLSAPQTGMVGIMASVGEVDDAGNIYATWNSTPLIGSLPSSPMEYDFTITIDGHLFQAGHRIGFSIAVGSLTYGFTVVAWFGGGPYQALAQVSTNSYLDITELLVYHEVGENRTKFYIDESPICFEVEVADPLSNLDVAEVRLVVTNATHTVLDVKAEPITNRSDYKTRYLAQWDLSGISAGYYEAEIRAVDNSGVQVSRCLQLLVVELHVEGWSYVPHELLRGLEEEQELNVSFSNGGNDVMYAVKLWPLDAGGLSISPSFYSVGDLGPGEGCSLSFNVLVPLDAELGLWNITFKVEYNDFRAVKHEELLRAEVRVVRLGVKLSLLLEPSEARILDNITATVGLLDYLGEPLSDQAIRLSLDGHLLAKLTTNSSGMASYSFVANLNAGPHIVTATFPGTYLYEESEVSAQLYLRLRASSIEVKSYPPEVEVGQEATIEALLVDEDGWPIAGAPIRLYVLEGGSWIFVSEGKTGEDGLVSIPFTLDEVGTWSLKLAFPGDDVHEGAEATIRISCTERGDLLTFISKPGNMAIMLVALACTGIAVPIAIWLKKRRAY